MTREILREREGMITYRKGDFVIKESRDLENELALRNAYRFFRALQTTPYIPTWRSYQKGRLVYDFIEETPVTDTEVARRNVANLLQTLRDMYINHGDLTAPNFVFRDNIPVVFDWDQSIFMHEPKPQKRPKLDAYHIWPAVVDKAGDPSRVIRRWLACMPHIEYWMGWGTLVDLGTHMGDFPGMAAAQGIWSLGVDGEFIRPCIDIAQELWSETYLHTAFLKCDIADYLNKDVSKFNIVMMFSTWPYIVQQHGQEKANWVLQRCINLSDIFLFETQYAGDGPGPDFITNDNDAVTYVRSVDPDIQMVPVVTLPVGGREAARTVWKITK